MIGLFLTLKSAGASSHDTLISTSPFGFTNLPLLISAFLAKYFTTAHLKIVFLNFLNSLSWPPKNLRTSVSPTSKPNSAFPAASTGSKRQPPSLGTLELSAGSSESLITVSFINVG